MSVANNAWRLFYPAGADRNGNIHPGGDITFGKFTDNTAGSRIFLVSEPETSIGEQTTNDVFLAFEDSRRFGVDYSGSNMISFEIGVDNVDTSDSTLVGRGLANADSVGALRRAWRADAVRTRSGVVAELSRGLNGRTRMVYGRPRRFSIAGTTHSTKGYTSVVADFQCADDLMYDEAVSTTQVVVTTSVEGGLLTPLASPLSTSSNNVNTGTLTIGGNAPTWVTVKFTGPVINPVVQITNSWKVSMLYTLTAGQAATIDPRPWVRTVTRENGGSLGAAFTRDSVMLAAMKLEPGTYAFTFTGTDPTNTATCRLDWKNAYLWW